MQGTAEAFITESQKSFGPVLLFILGCLGVLILIYRTHRIPKYIFRKLLHILAFTIVSLMIGLSASWKPVCVISAVIIITLFPLLKWFSRKSYFPDFFAEKEPGEVLMSFVMLFVMLSIICAIGWGAFGRKDLSIASILIWGVGDAAAALVGIPFGRHKANISLKLGGRTIKLTDGRKSVEGSAANAIFAAAAGLGVLMLLGLPMAEALAFALFGGLASALTELLSPSEYDTISVPICVLGVLLLVSRFI
jgi:dolichol kinase